MKLIPILFVVFMTNLANANSLYDIKFKSVNTDTKEINLSDYKGKVVLIVNTASKCSFTGQYDGLEELWEKYGPKGLVVIAVPTNDFGGQEPGSNEEIKNFCEVSFNVTFPLSEKVSSKEPNQHQFFSLAKSQFGYIALPKWNFYKYLFDKEGKPVGWFSSLTKPTSPKLVKLIEENLNK